MVEKMMSPPASASYQKAADMMRQAAREKLGPRDPAHQLLTLAADQLENAADTAQLLEQLMKGIEGKPMGKDIRPKNAGQWENDRASEIRRARAEGFAAGAVFIAVICALLIAAVLS